MAWFRRSLSIAAVKAALTASVTMASIGLWASGVARADEAKPFRPPSVPLVTADPYLSIWSNADHLTDDTTRHWTRREHALVSLIRIDGAALRLMGKSPKEAPVMPQLGVTVQPTRSIYEFENAQVHVTMTFMSPGLPEDLDALTRPLSYITWQVHSIDGQSHATSIYYSTSSELAVNEPSQKVQWKREEMGPVTALSVGTEAQTLFQPAGDDTRITWGYAYTSALTSDVKAAIGSNDDVVKSFTDTGKLPEKDDDRMPRPVSEGKPVLAFAMDLGPVTEKPVSRHVTVAYDEVYSIQYFGQKLRPYWRRNGATPSDLLQTAEKEYESLTQRCEAFDKELVADLTKVGGARYAQIAALAYRQCLCANGYAADANKQLLMFTKENTSNGDIATVDVFFPQDPIFILLSPALAKASIVPILSYGNSPRWKFPNSPHDLGVYPVARGTDDGGEQMPVEESGNMLILCDAIARAEGNADFVTPWWPLLTRWAAYLEQFGLDPENQLCTDDFMGHLAHNSNLSVKAVLALAAYGDLCKMRGDTANAAKYMALAKADAAHWVKVAADPGPDGKSDHFRLAFDKPHTWSQKYNLVWDHLLGLNVFPPEVARQEVAYYKTVMQKYGVPLDSRTKLTKTDWSVWSATLADNQSDFEAIISPIYDYLSATKARSPLVDSYETDKIDSDGMRARPVVGGIFIKMLSDPQMWKKWASRDKTKIGGWAELPTPPTIVEVVPSSQSKPQIWKFTTDRPAADWAKPAFDAVKWGEGNGGFGTNGTPGAVIGTVWKTDDIWIRREFIMPAGEHANLQFSVYHDEDVEIYVDGVLAATAPGYENGYVPLEISATARALLKPGEKITLAVHCHQTKGGQGVDVGLVDVIEGKPDAK